TRAEWQNVAIQPLFQEIAQLWEKFTPQQENEAQTEDVLIRPVLRALGHHFTVQVSLKTPLGTRRPDYVFFPDKDAQETIKGKTAPLTEHDLRGAFAVGDAKAWELRLDQPVKTAQAVSANPGFQIDFYIRHSGVPWGILTNGRHWRLYHSDSSKKFDVYYEVDLPGLLECGDLERFKYFLLFFRQEAFSGQPSWLESVLEESRAYSQGVSRNLKEQVYESLRCLAQGLLSFPANQLQPTPETLTQIYDNSLIVLYRLLFILYAESRALLPVHTNPAYMQSYSLHEMKRRIADELSQSKPAVTSVDNLWYQLYTLWTVINTGNAELGVPVYNGGLFHPEKHPFLEQYKVGDPYLREAIDLLTRTIDPATNKKEFVDYRDLEIRHLGSIYEGLLEYQVQSAAEPLLIEKEKGREVYVAAQDAQTPPDIKAGDVYLMTDKGERKATGSYYTPEYIVQYIVEHTVGPALDELRERHGENHNALIHAILTVNVLDPAVGSGHFLVAATDFMARYLVALELDVDSDEEDELSYWRRRVAQACIYGVDANPLAVELAKLSLWLTTVAKEKPLSFLDHHLRCGNSLIGAQVRDLMLTAVPTQSRRQKQKEQRAEAAGQMSLLNDSAFAGSMSNSHHLLGQLEALQSDTIADVQKAEKLYRKVADSVTSKIHVLADVWTAMSFGLDFNQKQWRSLTNYLLHNGGERFKYFDTILEKARKIADAHRFFHWELEFPDLFFDKHGRLLEQKAGFDAVIGNPPYVRSIRLKDHNIEAWKYYSTYYEAAAKKEFDIYLCFTEQGQHLIHPQGLLGFIMPNKWFTTQVGEALRSLLLRHRSVEHVVDFASFQVFPGITTYTCLLFLSGSPCHHIKAAILQHADNDSEPLPAKEGKWQVDKVSFASLQGNVWNFSMGASRSTLRKLLKYPPLKNIATVFSGTGTRADQIFLMEQKDRRFFSRSLNTWVEIEHALMQPALTGRDVAPYTYAIPNNLLFPYQFVEQEVHIIPQEEMLSKYPKAWAYLNHSTNREILEGRDKGAFRDREDWYGYGRPQNMHLLRLPKLVLPDVADKATFACDFEGRYIIDTMYGIRVKEDVPLSLPALAALLNSSLMTFFLQQTGTNLRGGYFRMKTAYLNPFPVPPIAFVTPEKARADDVETGTTRYKNGVSAGSDRSLLQFVKEQLSQQPKRTDVVHDLLAYLAEQMTELHKQHRIVEKAKDPFKYLNRSSRFVKLTEAFAGEIKYSQFVREPIDLSSVHHDILGLQLVSSGDEYELQVHLKKRDSETQWRQWLYQEDGKTIAREWAPVYRFTVNDKKARYYQQAFGVLEHFSEAKSFPGGCTNTTMKKLQRITIPAFDGDVDVTPLRELEVELAEVQRTLNLTDRSIDRIVYQLYGLTDKEIAIVEGRTRGVNSKKDVT
ncbi:MAG: N-6 DNA methylase, partial [bacterium]|nr:N-6 DNA methylase [bacterium]